MAKDLEKNLLDLVHTTESIYRQWSVIARVVIAKAAEVGVWAGSGADEDAWVDPGGSLVIFAQLGHERLELRVMPGEWGITPFQDLAPEVQRWVAGLILDRTPHDRLSQRVSFEGQLFACVDVKSYLSPNQTVSCFMYLGVGPFQVFHQDSTFRHSLGDAAPAWACGK